MAAGNAVNHGMPFIANDPSLSSVYQLQQSFVAAGPDPQAQPGVDHGRAPTQSASSSVVPGHGNDDTLPGHDRYATTPVIPPDIDTSVADLRYIPNPRPYSLNNPSPDGWLYPHKKGIGTGSNLEAFKDEIESRTLRGENCKAIADALNAMGVQTSDRAVSRVRIKWGMRKRAQRKVKTPPPGSEAARMSAKAKVQALRKVEITRMTREGMTAEQIYENLTSRGMELKKGVATVLRLQSAWKLAHNAKRWVENFRHQCHKQAKAQQLQALKDIAQEMALDDTNAWLASKMAEQPVRQARQDLALKLMGSHAPSNPERRKLQNFRPRRTGGTRQKTTNTGDHSGGSSSSESESESDVDSVPDYDSSGQAFAQSSYVVDSFAVHEDAEEQDGGFASLNDRDDDDGGGGDDDDDDNDNNDNNGDDQDEADGAAAMANNAHDFARVGQTSPQQTSTPKPSAMSARAAQATTTTHPGITAPLQAHSPSPATTSTFVPARSSNHGSGRSLKKPASKQAPIPSYEAPVPVTSLNLPCTIPAPADPTKDQNPALDASSPNRSMAPAAAQALIIRPEEAEFNRSTLNTLDQYHAAAQVYKNMLKARNEGAALPGSLTGLPPSSNEVEAAKRKLKEATQAMMLALQ